MRRELLDQLIHARESKRPVALIMQLETSEQALYLADATHALQAGRGVLIERDGDVVFIQALNPPLRMIIVGAVHIAQVMAPIATRLGYDVVIVDPRKSFADDQRFPGAEPTTEWPEAAMPRLAPDRRTAVVTLLTTPNSTSPRSAPHFVARLSISALWVVARSTGRALNACAKAVLRTSSWSGYTDLSVWRSARRPPERSQCLS